ncbi:hypothetical protein [Saccharothrix sp. Mg75]|uniref:hypothetical protein n=1 Tax=Saccharothrix sp. Mg75 TaxID=3445357 RepID=UPI003EED3197
MTRFDAHHDDSEPHEAAIPAAEQPEGDADRPSRVAREVSRALWGRDLLGPRPGWWLWGAKARARAHRRRELREAGAQRRAELHHQFTRGHARGVGDVRMPWRPVPIRRNIAAITGVITVIAAVVGLAWSADGPGTAGSAPRQPSEPASTPTGAASATSMPVVQPSGAASAASSLPEQPPIPASGVAPTVVQPRTGTDPATIVAAAAPEGPPARQELAGPESAARAWLARWCPFTTTHDQFGDAEKRARTIMTADAWSLFDPAGDDRAAHSWQQATAAGESGTCSAPVAQIVPSAPRTSERVVVRVTADRVVTTAGGTRYVESVSSTRVMLRQGDGTWRVDLAAVGG